MHGYLICTANRQAGCSIQQRIRRRRHTRASDERINQPRWLRRKRRCRRLLPLLERDEPLPFPLPLVWASARAFLSAIQTSSRLFRLAWLCEAGNVNTYGMTRLGLTYSWPRSCTSSTVGCSS